MSSKQSRKELLKQDDVFLSTAGQGVAWVKVHRMQVMATVAALVVVVGTAYGASSYLDTRQSRASEQFRAAAKMLEAEVRAAPTDGTAQAEGTYATDIDKWKAAREAFKKVVSEAGTTGLGDMAAFYVADLTAKLGERDEAEKQFRALLDALSKDDAFYALAVERVAFLAEESGKIDEAIATLEPLVKNEKAFYHSGAAYEQARIYAKKGETDKARELLKKIDSKSPIYFKASEKLRELGPGTSVAQAADGGATAAGAGTATREAAQ